MDIVVITDKILHTNSQSFNYSLAGLLDCCYIWYKLCGATVAQLTEDEILSFQSMAVIAYDQVAEKCVSFQMMHSLKRCTSFHL